MSAPRRRLSVWLCAMGAIGVTAGVGWHVSAQGGAAPPRPPVRALKGRAAPAPVSDGDRGATYHTLERQAIHVRTTFRDAVIEADRASDGQLSSRVLDRSGNERGTFHVRPVDADNDTLEFLAEGGSRVRAARRAHLRPTLDWASAQAYSLWSDRAAVADASLEWQDTLMRPKGAARRDVASEALKVETEFRDGFTAEVTRKNGTHVSYVTNRPTTGVVYQSVLRQEGVEVGVSQWWPAEQAFAWSFPGLNATGYVTADRLQSYGGWTFTPDMAWLNMQNLALQQFGAMLKSKGTIARTEGGWFGRLGQLISPTAHANEPGCDTQHWLDGTVLRWCCDVHDWCYQAYSCSAGSWWVWNWFSSWQCSACNADVAYCFYSGGTGHVFYRLP